MGQKISLFLFVIFSVVEINAAVFEIEKENSQIEFLAIGKPSLLKIKGKGARPEGKISIDASGGVTGEIKIDLNDFDTGIALRNQHMRDKYLQTSNVENRYSVFKVTKIENSKEILFSAGRFENISVEGVLKFHGVERVIISKATVDVKDKKVNVETKLKIKLSDFNIEIPTYLGVTVAEDVEIDITLKGRVLNEAL